MMSAVTHGMARRLWYSAAKMVVRPSVLAVAPTAARQSPSERGKTAFPPLLPMLRLLPPLPAPQTFVVFEFLFHPEQGINRDVFRRQQHFLSFFAGWYHYHKKLHVFRKIAVCFVLAP